MFAGEFHNRLATIKSAGNRAVVLLTMILLGTSTVIICRLNHCPGILSGSAKANKLPPCDCFLASAIESNILVDKLSKVQKRAKG